MSEPGNIYFENLKIVSFEICCCGSQLRISLYNSRISRINSLNSFFIFGFLIVKMFLSKIKTQDFVGFKFYRLHVHDFEIV